MTDTENSTEKRYLVQVGKGSGKYENRYPAMDRQQADFWYDGLNIHSGYKKRMVDTKTGRAVRRYIS